MRIKLDENMPAALVELLLDAGHDALTVPAQGLSGAEDPKVLDVARAEQRILMTFDVGFGNIREFPVGTHWGIVVFRLHDQRWTVLEKPARRMLESGVLDRLGRGLAIIDETRARLRTAQ